MEIKFIHFILIFEELWDGERKICLRPVLIDSLFQ